MTARTLGLLAALASLALAAPSAAGAEPPVRAGEPGWHTFVHGSPLLGSTFEKVSGRREGAGCRFDASLSLPPDVPAIAQREAAINVSRCEAVVETGIPTVVEEEAASAAERGSDAGVAPVPARRLASARRSLAYHSAGFMKTYWEDPVQLDVNSVRNGTDWYWNGSCVVGSYYNSYAYGWYSPSGWQKVASDWNRGATCYQTNSASYVHYKNPYFCFTIDTHAYYDRNRVNGRYNGYLVGSVSSWVSGGCTGLLSRHIVLRRTLN